MRWPLLLISSAVALLVLLWHTDPAQWRLPLCTFYASTGLYCPGCGGVRATHELLHGHVLRALHDNAFWIACLPIFAYAALSELSISRRGRPLPGNPSRQTKFFVALAIVGLLFCVLRNLPWYPWTLIVPLT